MKNVLDKKRSDILFKLGFLKNYGFYLVGGTALALQIRHRISYDFDFYTNKEFNKNEICRKINNIFPHNKLKEAIEKGTLIMDISGVELSLFEYPYKLIKPLIPYKEIINLASIEDISAMKIVAISQRGKARDFVDLYYLLQIFNLEQIFGFVKLKYKDKYDEYNALRGMCYFEDAEIDVKENCFKIKRAIWNDIKKFMLEKADGYVKKST